MSRPDDLVDLAEALDPVDLTDVFDLQTLTPEQLEWAERARQRLRLRDQLRRKDPQ
jgi:hypothetical protein